MDTHIDAFDAAYIHQRRVHRVMLASVWALIGLIVAFFAAFTGLVYLRWTGIVLALVPLPFLAMGLIWWHHGKEIHRAFTIGAISMLVLWIIIPLGWMAADKIAGTIDLEEKFVHSSQDGVNADKDQAVILAAIQRAKDQPSALTFRALIPYLDRNQSSLVLEDGTSRDTSSIVREALWSDTQLLFRTMHDEAMAMAALLPADAKVIPPVIEVNVPERLELALKTLINAHSEVKIQGSFDVPSIGIKIDVEKEGDVSKREIGITYPYGSHFAGDTIYVNAGTVEELLGALRKDLKY